MSDRWSKVPVGPLVVDVVEDVVAVAEVVGVVPIVGTVADSSGAIIPRVSLTLTNLGTTAKLTTESDNTGLYQFLNLPPGNYRAVVRVVDTFGNKETPSKRRDIIRFRLP